MPSLLLRRNCQSVSCCCSTIPQTVLALRAPSVYQLIQPICLSFAAFWPELPPFVGFAGNCYLWRPKPG
eukprot:8673765-Pyramimonas_sp.AAC.1